MRRRKWRFRVSEIGWNRSERKPKSGHHKARSKHPIVSAQAEEPAKGAQQQTDCAEAHNIPAERQGFTFPAQFADEVAKRVEVGVQETKQRQFGAVA